MRFRSLLIKRFRFLALLLLVWAVGLLMGSYITLLYSLDAIQTDNHIYDALPIHTPKTQTCTVPEIDPFDPSIEHVFKRRPYLNCSAFEGSIRNVVYLDNYDTVRVDHKKVAQALKNSSIFDHCKYHVVTMIPGSDSRAQTAFIRGIFTDSMPVNPADENIKIECVDTRRTFISISYFSFIRADKERVKHLEENYKSHIQRTKPAETLSILIIGIDSMAKQHFARSMPKTREFLIRDLGARELNKHHKVEYDTLPNVLALLTGRTQQEFMDDPIYSYNFEGWWDTITDAFIWSDAARRGYRTALMLDVVNVTMFHYLKPGFRLKPVDHYFRPLPVISLQDFVMRRGNINCFGDEEEITKLSDYWVQLVRAYNSTKSKHTPFFAYSLFTRLTHDDYNNAFAGDELYLKFFKDLKATNALENTVIVLFSDHGERYGELRHTYQGAIETNTPFTFFIFPPWFERMYPEVMRVFQANQDRLTSHWDTYETMKDILDFQGVPGPKGKLSERGISLFREIPEERTCSDAQIPPEYCVCAHFSKPSISSDIDSYLGSIIILKIMSILHPHKEQCEELRLSSINNVIEKTDTKTSRNIRLFRIGITTFPGYATFEAVVQFDVIIKVGEVVGDVVRTNMYRGQAECMDTANMRRYCNCKNTSVVRSRKDDIDLS